MSLLLSRKTWSQGVRITQEQSMNWAFQSQRLQIVIVLPTAPPTPPLPRLLLSEDKLLPCLQLKHSWQGHEGFGNHMAKGHPTQEDYGKYLTSDIPASVTSIHILLFDASLSEILEMLLHQAVHFHVTWFPPIIFSAALWVDVCILENVFSPIWQWSWKPPPRFSYSPHHTGEDVRLTKGT